MTANILMNLTNIVLNFFLIYDTRPVHPGGLALTIPGAGLGVVGAAIGTAVSYCVGGIFMIVVYWRNRILSPKGYPLHFDRSLAAKCLRIGTPVALERVSACLGQVVFTSLVTRLGTLALATHSNRHHRGAGLLYPRLRHAGGRLHHGGQRLGKTG